MKLIFLISSLLLALVVLRAAATPPEITNVRASQRDGTKLVDIHYDAADADSDLLTIRIEVSDNDGARYSVPAFTLSGDIGEGIAPGTGKHIVWDAGTDWDGEYSDLMRVMVFAVDAQGYPGMEWGNEVAPGGFLLGQDGGVEGSGPAQHVNIPWPYWLSKYEITARQYCDFLNAAFAAGRVAVKNFSAVYSVPGTTYSNFSGDYLLCNIGDAHKIRWNVNKFEVVSDRDLYPVSVTWHGAMAFAQFYGYDLPTEAEWEKAARGPDFDDQGEHCLYTWGNDADDGKANFTYDEEYISSQRPVGYYNGNQIPSGPDMVNGYGCYDMTGNASEWTRSIAMDYSAYMIGTVGTNNTSSESSGTTTNTLAELGGTLAAGCLSASGKTKNKPIVPGSFIIMIGSTIVLSDDGSGTLSGSGGSGTVSYNGGTWSFSLNDSLWSTDNRTISITYAYTESSDTNGSSWITPGTKSESGGTLPGGSLSASGKVQYCPIIPNSFNVTIGSDATLSDDGSGTLSGSGGSGTVSYDGGTWSFTLADTQWASWKRTITISYAYGAVVPSGASPYPSPEDLEDSRHQYWKSPSRFIVKSGAPIYSRTFPLESTDAGLPSETTAGFRVIRRYITDDAD